ncbi:endopeptidase La [Ancylomarina euxinus]|uniref:Lon protease n=1 Tax=Ancylomarina euxinus TaxID=2283627 RepID=A0A425XX70_9BACT|nr:endopeptidase La [Ancylomarina euxinus]MCZ4696134.1 endopeptidase La [Ancylomarina euxinus]MUP16543.1 endopeptidase La [Ancylomarina euxinus]RRG19250.1 endopeptidase La [Ancylomarina euxinus]
MSKIGKKDLVLVSDIYPDNIIVLPIEDKPLFPGITLPLLYTGIELVDLITYSLEKNNGFMGISFIKEVDEEDFSNSVLFKTGTFVKIIKVIEKTEDEIHFLARALTRFEYVRKTKRDDKEHWTVRYQIEERGKINDELRAYTLAVINSVKELIKLNPMFQEQIRLSVTEVGMQAPGLLMDIVSSFISSDPFKLQELLETFDLHKRSEKLLILLKEEVEITRLQEDIQSQISEKISSDQREFFLREQLKVIKKELGLEKDDKTSEIEKIEEKIKALKFSKEAAIVVQEELDKLRILDSASPEFNVSRSYLNWLTDMPWGIFSKDNYDIKKARKILNEQHYGLDDVKQRILEFVSTIVKRGKVSGSIICLVGPPGVGKTSIGKSIADALNRKFYRFSLGGMRDEAEIKGHRRTYIGAMPGKITQSLKRTKTSNPVIMLDEIDKIGISYQGDPASALLEVLDPEQNTNFLDHYLDVHFDLSNILFVTTANQLDTIPRPLLDRMEIIKLSGYILEEKVEIAKRYLIPKQRKEHGLTSKEITITHSALSKIIEGYAREAGVRSLENQIKKIMRKATLILAEEKPTKLTVSNKNIIDFLGQAVFVTEELYNKSIPGVTLGLAWTAYGGATLYIEASAIKHESEGFKQTGQLGNVMQESAHIAYSYIRSLLSEEKDESINTFFDKHLIHLHVPAGATPKDGPSAGITMALALHSLANSKPIKKGIAMTGELSLTGKILPIGGIREKTIAAIRVGIHELIFPKENKKDFDDLPQYLKHEVKVHFADYFTDVLTIAYS